MMTITKAPARELREHFERLGYHLGGGGGLREGDWVGVGCGDKVLDGRHVGRVKAVLHGATVRVVWEDTEWATDLTLEEAREMKRAYLEA